MGLIGGGDDSSLASSSGWGGQPPPSSSDWGSSSNNNSNSSSAGGSNWASAGSCGGSGASVSAAMAISGSNGQAANGPRSSQSSGNQGNMLMSSQTSSDQQQSLLSSSPKPLSSSWAQAAGKGLAVHATSASSGNANGPNSTASTASAMSSSGAGITTNSHDTSNVGGGALGFGGATMSAQSCSSQQQHQQQSSGASSGLSTSNVATTANSSSGGPGGMSANNVNSTMAYASSGASSSNGNNSSGAPAGLNMLAGSSVVGSSGNSMDAANATANKRQIGGSSSAASGAISDLIGGLSDDFRETLLTEKWGASVINQDSPWNLPSSSHTSSSSPKVHQDTSTWRCPVNSGTEIWESSIRQKKGSLGAPSGSLLSSASVGMPVGGAPVQPWGQAPTSNIGGTWGEEEGIDTSNHWTGVPHSSSLNSVTSVGGGGNGGMPLTGAGPSLAHSALAGHVNSSSINPNWSAGPSALSNGGPGSGIISNPYSLLNPSGLGASALAANSIAGDNGPPGASNWNGNDKNAYESRKATNWGNFDQSDSVSESNWDKSGNENGSFGTWNPPDNRKDGCWDKESNDSFKGVDDGTAVWGNPSSGSAGNSRSAGNNNGNGQHGLPAQRPQPPNWKDQQQQKYGVPMPPVNKNGYSGNPGWNNGNNGGAKPLNQNNMLTRTWTDASSGHRKSPSMWNDDSKSINGNMERTNNWSDGQIDTSSWGSSKPMKPLTREMILSSKQFRLLVDLGHKKDDAEAALRNYSLRFEDALAHLENTKPIKSGFGVGAGGTNPLMDFNKMTINAGGNGGNGLGRTHAGLAPMPLNTASNCQPNSLHTLAQRIHVAVSAGFLNPQILNQPLSNQNLEILSELLNQIKLLKEVQGQMAQSNGSLKSSLEYRHREVRQNITQLQNQLRNDAGVKIGSNGLGKDMFENNEGPINKEMFQLSKGPVDNYSGNGGGAHTGGLQGSRLFNWKHSKQQSATEHGGPMGSDFIRAPGGLPKSNHSTTNWSNFMDDNAGGWPDKAGDQHHASAGGALDCDYGALGNFAPMVPDTFDSYGKHSSWKPTAKSVLVEDDPRSPISQKTMMNENAFPWNSAMGGPSTNAISKGSNSLLGGGGGQCPPMDSLNSPFGFSGNTWSYNSGPASSAAGNAAMGVNAAPFSGELNKNKNAMNKSSNTHTWSNSGLNTAEYSDSLWTPPGGNNGGNGNGPAGGAGKPRPPPGLSKNSGNSTSTAGGNSIWSSGANGSEYLRLRNLTPQIDGSTLKTLCCQHGPLNLFHLFLNHGAAIARYANREQAIKAQSALNNCVLGNTTILADLPQESEVQQYMQLINGGGHSANPNGSGAQSGNTAPHNSSSGGPSHNAHHGSGSGHHSGYGGNPTTSWSNGTNASQSNAGGGTGIQSNAAAPSTAPVSLYSRTSSVGASGPNSAPITVAHMAPFASSAVNLPYNSGALVTSHSNYNNVLNQAAPVSAATQFSKMDNGLLSSWNTASSGTGGLWDSSALPGAGGGLWSTGGYGDRNTPIQNAFLPGDLLTGDNN